MTRRLLLTYLSLTAVVLAVVVIPLGTVFARGQRAELTLEVEHGAGFLAAQVEDSLERGLPLSVDRMMANLRQRWDGRVAVVDARGVCVAKAPTGNAVGTDCSRSAGISRALVGRRSSGTFLAADGLAYVAVPVASGGVVHGAVHVAYPTKAVDAAVRRTWLLLGMLCLTVLAAVAGAGYALARGVSMPLRQITAATERIALGDLSARAPQRAGPPELRELAATFNATADRLGQLVESQRRFVGDAAHQLRTPLTALRLRIENLEPSLPDTDQDKLRAALMELDRLAHLVDGLLLLASNDGAQPAPCPDNLAEAVARRLEVWQYAAEAADVRLRSGVPAGTLVLVVPGALDQILDNLLSNALAVSPPRSTITVTSTTTVDAVVLHVTDEGTGLDEAQRAHAFERFWRSDNTRAGSGLGLTIVRQLARASGGDASLHPGPGGMGTELQVTLPAPSVQPRGRITERGRRACTGQQLPG